jgi:hypothetical protein
MCCNFEKKKLTVLKIKYLQARLKCNRELHAHLQNVECASFVWGQSDVSELNLMSDKPCLVLSADCLLPYNPELLLALAQSIASLISYHKDSVAIVAYEERCNVVEFYKQVERLGMEWRELDSIDKGTLKILKVRLSDSVVIHNQAKTS